MRPLCSSTPKYGTPNVGTETPLYGRIRTTNLQVTFLIVFWHRFFRFDYRPIPNYVGGIVLLIRRFIDAKSAAETGCHVARSHRVGTQCSSPSVRRVSRYDNEAHIRFSSCRAGEIPILNTLICTLKGCRPTTDTFCAVVALWMVLVPKTAFLPQQVRIWIPLSFPRTHQLA